MRASSAETRSSGRAGAPLRFLALTLGLWIGLRVAMTSSLFAQAPDGAPVETPGPVASVTSAALGYSPQLAAYAGGMRGDPARRLERAPIVRRGPDDGPVAQMPRAMSFAFATSAASLPILAAASAGGEEAGRSPASTAPALPAGSRGGTDRWSASAWAFWRSQGGGRSLGSGGQLGGSQAGARLERALGRLGSGRGMPVSAYARVTTALRGPMAPEAALGIAVRPLSGRAPVMLGVERRIGLDRNGRNAFALVAAGGLNPTRVIGSIAAEGYAQAGMVGLSRRDPFIDGRLSVTAPLGRGGTTRAGFSLSGGAQPGAARLDFGPAFETRLPLGRVRPRLTVEWRQRVAGKARPGSGVAVTLANDF